VGTCIVMIRDACDWYDFDFELFPLTLFYSVGVSSKNDVVPVEREENSFQSRVVIQIVKKKQGVREEFNKDISVVLMIILSFRS